MRKIKDKNLTEDCVIVNRKTGEIVQPDENASSSQIILREAFYDDTPVEEREMGFCSDDLFQKIFKGTGLMLFKELTYSELALCVLLQDFVCYSDCSIRKGGRRNGRLLTMEDISQLTGIKVETIKKTMYSLRDKEVIGIHPYENNRLKKWFSMNPYVFHKGSKIKNKTNDYYANSRWAKYHQEFCDLHTEE